MNPTNSRAGMSREAESGRAAGQVQTAAVAPYFLGYTVPMRDLILCLIPVFLVVALGTAVAQAPEEPEHEAIAAAEGFLALVDRGEYGLSWDRAAALFKGTVSREQWTKQIGAIRPALGTMVKRTLMSATRTGSLPGVPDGDYVVIQYWAVFSNKSDAVEAITPMKDPDGVWRVSGYYIR